MELFFLLIGLVFPLNYMVYQDYNRLREQEAMHTNNGQERAGKSHYIFGGNIHATSTSLHSTRTTI